MKKITKWTLICLAPIITVMILIALAGMYKFNYLASLKGYDVDGNKIDTTETYNLIEGDSIIKLNLEISTRKLNTIEEIINAYRPESEEQGDQYTYTTTKRKIDETFNEITIIEDGLLNETIKKDGAINNYVMGRKAIMTTKLENGLIKVVSIKENYKCYFNKGYEKWGLEMCE